MALGDVPIKNAGTFHSYATVYQAGYLLGREKKLHRMGTPTAT